MHAFDVSGPLAHCLSDPQLRKFHTVTLRRLPKLEHACSKRFPERASDVPTSEYGSCESGASNGRAIEMQGDEARGAAVVDPI